MRIAEWINGAMTYRDATAEEIAEAENTARSITEPQPEPTLEQRLAAAEGNISELENAVQSLLDGSAER